MNPNLSRTPNSDIPNYPIIASNYTILCGFFSYDSKTVSKPEFLDRFKPWEDRIPHDSILSYNRFISSYYYPTFVKTAFPDASSSHIKSGFHWTLTDPPETRYTISCDEVCSCSFKIEYVDLFLYPEQIGVFALKTVITPSSDRSITIQDVSNLHFLLRSDRAVISSGADSISLFQHIRTSILFSSDTDLTWTLFGNKSIRREENVFSCNNKLKTYCVIETDPDAGRAISQSELDQILFELGTGAKIGTIREDGDFAPSKLYYDSIIETDTISVFNNWKALSLFDTFTVVISKSQSGEHSTFNNFLNVYLPIYIHVIFLKFILFYFNLSMSRLDISNRRNLKIRDSFIGITNLFCHSHISHNFLPNSLLRHMMQSLALESEINEMEKRIDRIGEHINQRNTETINTLLAFMAFIAPFSVLYDVSEWIAKLFSVHSNYISISISLVIAFICSTTLVYSVSLVKSKHRNSKTKF